MARPSRQRERESASTETTDQRERERACDECSDGTLVTSEDQGELVCDQCGLVVEGSNIDHGPEWRAFNHSERQSKSRVGAPTTQTMHDKGLTTSIDWKNQDAYGRSISADKRSQMRRLRKWQERIRTKDAGERNLQFALSEIDRMASSLGIPRSVREVACVIYRRALDEDLIRGRSIEGVATSTLYAACRMPLLSRLAAGLLGMDVGESRALVFTSVTRNSLVILPLALALPSGYALAPAVVVTQTLIELTGMVVLTRVVPGWLLPNAPSQTPSGT